MKRIKVANYVFQLLIREYFLFIWSKHSTNCPTSCIVVHSFNIWHIFLQLVKWQHSMKAKLKHSRNANCENGQFFLRTFSICYSSCEVCLQFVFTNLATNCILKDLVINVSNCQYQNTQ